MYKKAKLRNGLRIITHPMKDRESVAVGIWVGVGGRYEEDEIKGAAHFLEHIVFKGSKAYSCGEIKEKIEGVGGMLNAFTSEEQTCFYAKIPAKHLIQTFEVLADMVLFPKIAKKDVEKEKTVIVEEIKMYHDLSQYFVMELFDSLLFGDHPLGKGLAGTPHSVTGMTNKDLKRFHRNFYNPENIVISIAGNVDHPKVRRMVSSKLGGLQSGKKAVYQSVALDQQKPRVKFHKRNIEQMHLVLGCSSVDETHPDRHAISLLSVILGGNMSSRLFVEVREKYGLAYSICCASKTLHDTGQFMIRAGVDNQKIVKAVELIIKEVEKIKKKGVSQGEFNRAKDYLLGQFMMGLEDTMEHMLWIGESLIAKNELKKVHQMIKAYEKIKLSDIKRVACDILDKRKCNLAVVGPITDEQEEQLKILLGA